MRPPTASRSSARSTADSRCRIFHARWAGRLLVVALFGAPGSLAAEGGGSGPRARAASVDQPKSAAALFRGLAALPGLSARYREEKRLSLLVEPLVSEGAVWFVPPGELIRATRTPAWSTLVVRPNAVTYTDDAGEQRMPLGRDHPARAFVQVFVDVVAGDLSAVERDFEVDYAAPPGGPWQLRLRPRRRDFPGTRQIRIRGDRLVISSLEIDDPNGDSSVTTFDRVVISRRPSASEIAQALRKVRK